LRNNKTIIPFENEILYDVNVVINKNKLNGYKSNDLNEQKIYNNKNKNITVTSDSPPNFAGVSFS
jgi:hypothetical protein